MSSPRTLVVEADGGSRGNPGPAGYGAVVRDGATGEVLAERAGSIGVATNNVAEYRGVIAGLAAARELDPDATLDIRLDSKLVVEQLSGRWKVKNEALRPLVAEAVALLPPGRARLSWVPRARNGHADRLANEAMDAAARGQVWREPRRTPSAVDDQPAEDRAGGPPATSVEVAAATRLLLVRHGATELTEQRRFSGRGGADPGLTDQGREQAWRAASWLGAQGPVALVVTSPLLRTRETAAVLASAVGAQVETDDDLAECAFGSWDSLTFAEVAERWPTQLAQVLDDPAAAPPGGESSEQVARRAVRARERWVARMAGRTVVLVSHSVPIRSLVRLALHAPPAALHALELRPGAVSEIVTYADGRATLAGFNLQP